MMTIKGCSVQSHQKRGPKKGQSRNKNGARVGWEGRLGRNKETNSPIKPVECNETQMGFDRLTGEPSRKWYPGPEEQEFC